MTEDNRPEHRIGRPHKTELMRIRHLAMLEYQERIAPFIPTIRELAVIWYGEKHGSSSSARKMLLNMRRNGLVITRKKNNRTSYYAIEKTGEQNE